MSTPRLLVAILCVLGWFSGCIAGIETGEGTTSGVGGEDAGAMSLPDASADAPADVMPHDGSTHNICDPTCHPFVPDDAGPG